MPEDTTEQLTPEEIARLEDIERRLDELDKRIARFLSEQQQANDSA